MYTIVYHKNNHVYIYVKKLIQDRPIDLCTYKYIYIYMYQNTIFPTNESQGAAGHFDVHYDATGRLKHLTVSSGHEFRRVQRLPCMKQS